MKKASEMKANSTTFIALILSCQFAFAQRISVEISPNTWEQLDKSFLLVSNNSGDIIFDQTFDRAACQNARRVAFEKVAGEQTHVTLFNQYTLNTEGSLLYLYNACTFYDVQSDLKVVDPPSYYLKPEFKSIVIWVDGAEEVDNFIVNSQTGNYEEYFYRMHNSVKGIKIKYDHQKGSDLFLALSCNGEGFYRYVYLPEGEILDEQTFEYSDLPSDLEIAEIPLPYKASWIATVKARNEDTQGQCYLYETKKLYETDTLRFSIRVSYFLFDDEVSLVDPRSQLETWSVIS